MTDLKAAVFTVLEGWALPLDARKILETAYYAQPEQEPVCDKDPFYCLSIRCQAGKVCKHTAPPRREWVGLTDDEIKEVLGLNEAPWSLSGVALQHVMDDVRAIEAKLKEKNT